ncbi:DctP family TRAP transporter solute-binding subunit [Salinicoccus sp. Marseille-QA3877]
MKRYSLLVLVFIFFISACSNSTASSEKEVYELEVAHVVASDHSYQYALEEFAENVQERSEGRIEINIFPSAQLGNERDLVESVSMGTVDMALSNSANLSAYTDSYMIFDLPFLFRDHQHAHDVLDSDIGEDALNSLDDIGVKGLANWENGFFNTWNATRPIEEPEDFNGLIIRANDNPIHIDSYEALNGGAVTMGWSEVYTGIQNGTVDGVSVSIPSMYTSNIHEVAPYISTSQEFYVSAILMMNDDLFNDMPDDLQTILEEEAKNATQFQRDLNKEIEDEALADLEEQGYEITHPDTEVFREEVWEDISTQYEDNLDQEKLERILNDFE